MQGTNRHRDQLAHAAVRMNAEHLEPHAAVRLSNTARNAGAAAQVRFDGAPIAGPDPLGIAGDLDDLDPQLVPEDARIDEERLVALVGVQVGAADPDAV